MPRHGENIRKRTDGRWEGRYAVYLPDRGRQQRSIYGKTYSEVKKKKDQALRNQIMGESVTLPPDNRAKRETFGKDEILLERVVSRWFEKIEKTKKHATYIKYCYIYKTYLTDILSDRFLADAATDQFQDRLISETAECSESIRKSIYSVLSGILAYGAELYHTPPVRLRRRKPARSKKKPEIYTRREQIILLRYLYGDMDVRKMGIILCLSTGLRLGEVCALMWKDIDFQNKVLSVNRTVQRIAVNDRDTKTSLYVGAPKTSCSQREPKPPSR